MAASREGEALDDQLLKKALKEGRRRANVAASSLGLGRVDLLRIHQRCSLGSSSADSSQRVLRVVEGVMALQS